jgi:hypothetical protein
MKSTGTKQNRKFFIIPALVLVLAGTLVIVRHTSRPPSTPTPKKWYELGMMADPILDQVLLFYLGEAWTKMTDINECLETASRIKKDDSESWSREWRKTAERLHALGDSLRS